MRSAVQICALVALATLSACSRSAEKKAGAADKPRTVRVVVAGNRAMESTLLVSGSLAAYEQATLSVKAPGRLERFSVDLGSRVRKGELIARIEPRDYELRLQQAAAFLAHARAAVGLPLQGEDDRFMADETTVVREAKAVLDEATASRSRIANLSKSGIASRAELDTTEAAYKVAFNRYEAAREEVRRRQADLEQRRAEYEIAKQQLADTEIVAPFDGAVGLRNAGVGEFLNAGAAVVTVVRTDPLRLRLQIPERESSRVRAGQKVRLNVEGIARPHTGALARLSPLITDEARVLVVEADIQNDGALRPGMFARAEIVLAEREQVLAVPAGALITFAGIEKVIVARDGKAQERVIATGRRGGDWIEIVQGLERGEQVVLNPGNLRTGLPLEIATGPLAESGDIAGEK